MHREVFTLTELSLCYIRTPCAEWFGAKKIPFIFNVTEIPAQTACFDVLDNDM